MFNEPVIVWCVIVAAIALIFVFSTFSFLRDRIKEETEDKHHFLEVGKVHDMFYIPGDQTDENWDDFEDL